jgi:ribosomal protein S18 acetylase RimI-like enzyme
MQTTTNSQTFSATSPTITMRAARLNDVAELEKLVHLAYRGGKATVDWKNENHLVKGPRIEQAELTALIETDEANILVAEIKDTAGPKDAYTLVGCVLVEHHGEAAHIGLLAVNPDCQNLGLGKQLVKAGEEHAANHFGCTIAKMFVLNGRDELLGWYKRLGYVETGVTEPFPDAETGLTAVDKNAYFTEISKPLG